MKTALAAVSAQFGSFWRVKGIEHNFDVFSDTGLGLCKREFQQCCVFFFCVWIEKHRVFDLAAQNRSVRSAFDARQTVF